ncbi:sensor histidine kinase [Kribbella italica]|uniref:histidine kinase n=1 Tax=Kribbella italica TaxID=1540520 RepID=A0A7W9J6X9_9ACTN|nr:sensor histidine kinase [Kribbella italica]MBB5836262.1 signal transduction histidine kinase [Kribbella italica]
MTGWPQGRWAWVAGAGTAALLVLTAMDLGQHYQLPLGAALALGAARALTLGLAWVRPKLSLPGSLATAVLTAAVCVPVSADEPWPWPVTSVFGHSIVLAVIAARASRRRAPGGPAGDHVQRGPLAGWWVATQLTGVGAMLLAPERGSWVGLLTMAVFSLVAVVIGDLQRSRAEARQQLVEQEELTEAERAERALWQERARIARELHDVVAHHLSVVVVRADSAPHRLQTLPEEVRTEFAGIAEEARSSLTEMRRVLRLLRSEPGELEPQPGLEDLAGLVERARQAGASIELDATTEEVDPAVAHTAYRVVQESISNAVRHAPGAAITVVVRQVQNELRVTVANSTGGSGTKNTTGHGLLGMRERVSLVDGTVRAESTPDGGFVVEAVMPAQAR